MHIYIIEVDEEEERAHLRELERKAELYDASKRKEQQAFKARIAELEAELANAKKSSK